MTWANSLIVVEHDEDTMRAADCIVDIGPGAGEHGGQLVGMGTAEELMKNPKSITGAYLSGKLKIPVPEVRKEPTGYLTVKGAAENNLKTYRCGYSAWNYDLCYRCVRIRQEFSDQ